MTDLEISKALASPEPVYVCRVCNETKAWGDMVTRKGGGKDKSGVRRICKQCRYAQQHASRISARVAAVEEAKATVQARLQDPNMTPPRTYIMGKDPLVLQDNTYYRNNGNKHIPSRGISA
jgi:hypothetical protein